MAVLMIAEMKGATPELYEQVNQSMGVDSDHLPDGLIQHVAGRTDDGLLAVDVWDSEESFARFAEERLGPALQELGVPPDMSPTLYPVHNLLEQHCPQRLDAQHPHRLARLERGRAEMRCEYDVLEREQLFGHHGLALEDVERGAGNVLFREGAGQRRLVHDRPAARVDERRGRLHQRERALVDQVVRLLGERQVEADDVGLAEQ